MSSTARELCLEEMERAKGGGGWLRGPSAAGVVGESRRVRPSAIFIQFQGVRFSATRQDAGYGFVLLRIPFDAAVDA